VTVEELKARLGLVPHPREGGYFRETYRSSEAMVLGADVPGSGGIRACSTAIYYLLTPETFSELHRLRFDEVFHFYLGDPVEMLQLHPDGRSLVVTLGSDLASGMTPQLAVEKHVWQGSRLRAGGRFALLGTTVAPGFDPEDYESGDRELLLVAYPAMRGEILALTRTPPG
jgi:uncharacterized protein